MFSELPSICSPEGWPSSSGGGETTSVVELLPDDTEVDDEDANRSLGDPPEATVLELELLKLAGLVAAFSTTIGVWSEPGVGVDG